MTEDSNDEDRNSFLLDENSRYEEGQKKPYMKQIIFETNCAP